MKSFDGFAAFAAQFAITALALEEVNQECLERAAVAIEKRAKEKIGAYQDQAGQFVAWAELAESTKQDRESKGYPDDEPLLRTGEMRDSIEHKVVGDTAHVGSNDDIAVYQELGTNKMPPRSFLGGAAFEKAPEVCELIGTSVTLHLSGEQVFQGKLPIERG